MAKNSDGGKTNSFNPFRQESMYSKTVTEQNKAQPGLYPEECNGCYSDVPSSMKGATRNIQEAP